MTHRRELLMWMAVVCALGFVLLAALQGSVHPSAWKIRSADGDTPESFKDIGGPGDTDFDLDSGEIPDVYRELANHQYPPVQYQKYRVRNGDNLWKIAKRFGSDVNFWYTLLSVNKLKNANSLRVGQTILIPDQPGILHAVEKGETLEDIALRYDVAMERIVDANQISNPSHIIAGTEIFIPHAKISLADQRRLERERNVPLLFAWPARTRRVTSRFGYRRHPITHRRTFHKGLDIGTGAGAPIYAAADGVVTFSGRMGGYGKLVVIRHPRGFETRYAHNSRLLVRKGQRVSRGQRIAISGNTGRTNGPHLHFEIWKNGKVQNPIKYLR